MDGTLMIIIDCFEVEEGVQLSLFRLRFRSKQLTMYPFDNPKLSLRIAKQLQAIHQCQPSPDTPFYYVKDWYGLVPPEQPIFDRMVKA